MSITLLRQAIKTILREDVYDRGSFSPERLKGSLQRYATGELPQIGVDPSVASDMTLDDMLVAFGEAGHDTDAEIQRALDDNDREAAEERIRDILNSDFIGPRGPLASMGLEAIGDTLLPGDEDRLVSMIADDIFDGDGMITAY